MHCDRRRPVKRLLFLSLLLLAHNVSVLAWMQVSKDGTDFVDRNTKERFFVLGFNYDHDREGRLIEEYWQDEWPTVVEDFKEMKKLGANVVRIHLQVGEFMVSPQEANSASLAQLKKLVHLAESMELYLDITGLGCYHKEEIPVWYSEMKEKARWKVQANFWEAIAKVCANSPAVFCYDLMNEPILPGPKKKETEWLAGEFGGKHFVQRIALDLQGRSRTQVAKKWVDTLVQAIGKNDENHMITVGVIPWALHFYPHAQKPIFYSPKVSQNLDFTSVHFYPQKGKINQALKALAVYDIGKPLVIEEIFPLKCGIKELNLFIDSSTKMADGWIGFYWGKTIEEYSKEEDPDLAATITKKWLQFFKQKTRAILGEI
ncbi:cellulase family glycosylhydrolase [bacterium]|nr:cellulase family glycosylhydrolase [bacterium]